MRQWACGGRPPGGGCLLLPRAPALSLPLCSWVLTGSTAAAAMPLIYSFVSRGNTVLADYTSYTGNFSTVALQVRGRAPRAGRPINAGAALLRQRGRPAGPCTPRQRLRGVISPWPARQPPAPRRWAGAAAAATRCSTPHCLRLPCRRWRRGHRAPTPSSHTRAMATVSCCVRNDWMLLDVQLLCWFSAPSCRRRNRPPTVAADPLPCADPLPPQPSTTSHQMDTVSGCWGGGHLARWLPLRQFEWPLSRPPYLPLRHAAAPRRLCTNPALPRCHACYPQPSWW